MTVGEVKAYLADKNDEDIFEIVNIPQYVMNIKPAPVVEPIEESTGENSAA